MQGTAYLVHTGDVPTCYTLASPSHAGSDPPLPDGVPHERLLSPGWMDAGPAPDPLRTPPRRRNPDPPPHPARPSGRDPRDRPPLGGDRSGCGRSRTHALQRRPVRPVPHDHRAAPPLVVDRHPGSLPVD